MITILSRIFIRNCTNYSDNKVRTAYGILCGVVGIVINVILCILKLVISLLTASVSVAADAFNNLSDAGSSVVMLFGFRLSVQKPDPSHPFGHGRYEYITGFIVSIIIMFMGFELGKSSAMKLTEPSDIKFSFVSVSVLCLSIVTKCYMYYYNRTIANKINSTAMKATAADSLNDCISTSAVLICTVASRYTTVNLDSICGIAVSLFILWSGIKSAKQMIDLLLGTPPDADFVEQIENTVLTYPYVSGIHDLIVHNYGPGRFMVSLHAEVPQNISITEIHDTIDNIEKELYDSLGCQAVIHMDPIADDDEQTVELMHKVAEFAKEIDPSVTIHDFRTVIGKTHTNLIFDIVVPFNFKFTDEKVKEIMREKISSLSNTFFAVIDVDKDYCSSDEKTER